MTNATTRRSLFAGAGAVVMGAGITAGAAASVADLVPVEAEPDADLVRLCGEFIGLELQWRAIYDGPEAVKDDDEAEALSTSIGERMNAMMDDMKGMQATTSAGILAWAHALAVTNGDFGCSFDYPDTVPGCLLECLLRDAATVAGRA